jgi:SAM-dependent methyltransferase
VKGLGHRHLVGVISREMGERNIRRPTILDAGCGDGKLLRLLSDTLPCSLSGFDSPNYGLQATERLGAQARAEVDIRFTHPDGRWPFEDSQFDIVVSNQVCEHVIDFKLFCAENYRVLKPGGIGVHTFPLRHFIIEPHMHLPLVHRIRDHQLRSWSIKQLSIAGVGIYKAHAKPAEVDLDTFAQAHADYARTYTTYRTWREVCDELHRHGFRVSYRHTSSLVQRGLWRLVGSERPGRPAPAILEAALFPILRSFVSCTLLVEKTQDYRFNWAVH